MKIDQAMAHDFEAGVLFKLPVVREIALGMGCCELSNLYVDSGQGWIVAGLPVRTDVLLTDCPGQKFTALVVSVVS